MVRAWLRRVFGHAAQGQDAGARGQQTADSVVLQPGDPNPASQTGRLLFVNQYYGPDHASTGAALGRSGRVARGRRARVPRPLRPRGYKPGTPRPPAFEVHNGVQIHRVPTTSLGRRSTLTRMIDYLSFMQGR